MSEPNPQPLAALLASHPEECAAVVAVLAISDPCDSLSFAGVMAAVDHYAPGMMANGGPVLDIGVAMGWIHVNPWREYGLQPEDRYAIARMGAAAWLRARLSVGDGLPAEIDVDGMVDARGIQFIGKAVRGADGAYLCLANVGGALCRVEVKVTRDRETGAGAPAKGEQR